MQCQSPAVEELTDNLFVDADCGGREWWGGEGEEFVGEVEGVGAEVGGGETESVKGARGVDVCGRGLSDVNSFWRWGCVVGLELCFFLDWVYAMRVCVYF